MRGGPPLGWLALSLLLSPFAASAGCPGERPTKQLICRQTDTLQPEFDPCFCTHLVLDTPLHQQNHESVERGLSYRKKNPDLQILAPLELDGTELGDGEEAKKAARRLQEGGLQGLFLDFSWDKEAPPAKSKILALIKDLATELDNVASGKRANRKYDAQDRTTTELPKEDSWEQSTGIVLRLPSQAQHLGKNYDLKKLSKYVDYFVIATENITDISEQGMTYHHSRLMGIDDILNADSLVDLVTGLGAPHDKLVMSLPAAAFKFNLADPEKNMPRSPTSQPPVKISQAELCTMIEEGGWTVERDEDLTAPYAFRKTTWVAFDDTTSAAIKGKYILLRDLAGAAVDSVQMEDWEGRCNSSKAGLLTTLHDTFTNIARKPRAAQLIALQEQLHQASLVPFSADVQLSPYRIVRVVDRAGSIHVVRKEAKTEFQCSRQGYFTHPSGCNRFYRCVKFNQYSEDFTVFEYDCPAGLAFDERYEVCVWPGSLPDTSACHGSSEIAPVPRTRYACPAVEGYYADPENCRWFFACLDHRRDGSALTAYEFRCPFGLVFNEKNLVCDWPWLVQGCGSSGVGVLGFSPGDILEGRLRPSYAHISDVHVSGGRIENVQGGLVLGSSLLPGVDDYRSNGGVLGIIGSGRSHGSGILAAGVGGSYLGRGQYEGGNNGQYVHDSTGDHGGEYVHVEGPSGGAGGSGGYAAGEAGSYDRGSVAYVSTEGQVGHGQYVHDARGDRGGDYVHVEGGSGTGETGGRSYLGGGSSGSFIQGTAGQGSSGGAYISSPGGISVGHGVAYVPSVAHGEESGQYLHDTRGDNGDDYVHVEGPSGGIGAAHLGGSSSGSYVHDSRGGHGVIGTGYVTSTGSVGTSGGAGSGVAYVATRGYGNSGQYFHDTRGDHGGNYVHTEGPSGGVGGSGAYYAGGSVGRVQGSTGGGYVASGGVESGVGYISDNSGQYVHDTSGDRGGEYIHVEGSAGGSGGSGGSGGAYFGGDSGNYIHDARGDSGSTGGAYVATSGGVGLGTSGLSSIGSSAARGSNQYIHGIRGDAGSTYLPSGAYGLKGNLYGLSIDYGAAGTGRGAYGTYVHDTRGQGGAYIAGLGAYRGAYLQGNAGQSLQGIGLNYLGGKQAGVYGNEKYGVFVKDGAYVAGKYAQAFDTGAYIHDNSGAYVHDSTGDTGGEYVQTSEFHGKHGGSGAYVSTGSTGGRYVENGGGAYVTTSKLHGHQGGSSSQHGFGQGVYSSGNGQYIHDTRGDHGGEYVHLEGPSGPGSGAYVATADFHGAHRTSGYVGQSITSHGGQNAHDNSGNYHGVGGQAVGSLGYGLRTDTTFVHEAPFVSTLRPDTPIPKAILVASTPRPLTYYQPIPSQTLASEPYSIHGFTKVHAVKPSAFVTTPAPSLHSVEPAQIHVTGAAGVIPSIGNSYIGQPAVSVTPAPAVSVTATPAVSVTPAPAVLSSHIVQPAVSVTPAPAILHTFEKTNIHAVRPATLVTPRPYQQTEFKQSVISVKTPIISTKAEYSLPVRPIINTLSTPRPYISVTSTPEVPLNPIQYVQRPLAVHTATAYAPSAPVLHTYGASRINTHVPVNTVQEIRGYTYDKPNVGLEYPGQVSGEFNAASYGVRKPSVSYSYEQPLVNTPLVTVSSTPAVPLNPVQYLPPAPVIKFSYKQPIVPQVSIRPIVSTTPAPAVVSYQNVVSQGHDVRVTSTPAILKYSYKDPHISVSTPVTPIVTHLEEEPVRQVSVNHPSPKVFSYSYKRPVSPIAVSSTPAVPFNPVQYIPRIVESSTPRPDTVSFSYQKPISVTTYERPIEKPVAIVQPTIRFSYRQPISVTNAPVVPLNPVQYEQKTVVQTHQVPTYSVSSTPIPVRVQQFQYVERSRPIVVPVQPVTVTTQAPQFEHSYQKTIVPLQPAISSVQYVQRPVVSTPAPAIVSQTYHKPIVPVQPVTVTTQAPQFEHSYQKTVVPLQPAISSVQYVQRPVVSSPAPAIASQTYHRPIVPVHPVTVTNQTPQIVEHLYHKTLVPVQPKVTEVPPVVSFSYRQPIIETKISKPIVVSSTPAVPLNPVQYRTVQPIVDYSYQKASQVPLRPIAVTSTPSPVQVSLNTPVPPVVAVHQQPPRTPVFQFSYRSPISITSTPAIPLNRIQYTPSTPATPILSHTYQKPAVLSETSHFVGNSFGKTEVDVQPSVQPLSFSYSYESPGVRFETAQPAKVSLQPLSITTEGPTVFYSSSKTPSPKPYQPITVSDTPFVPINRVQYHHRPSVPVTNTFVSYNRPEQNTYEEKLTITASPKPIVDFSYEYSPDKLSSLDLIKYQAVQDKLLNGNQIKEQTYVPVTTVHPTVVQQPVSVTTDRPRVSQQPVSVTTAQPALVQQHISVTSTRPAVHLAQQPNAIFEEFFEANKNSDYSGSGQFFGSSFSNNNYGSSISSHGGLVGIQENRNIPIVPEVQYFTTSTPTILKENLNTYDYSQSNAKGFKNLEYHSAFAPIVVPDQPVAGQNAVVKKPVQAFVNTVEETVYSTTPTTPVTYLKPEKQFIQEVYTREEDEDLNLHLDIPKVTAHEEQQYFVTSTTPASTLEVTTATPGYGRKRVRIGGGQGGYLVRKQKVRVRPVVVKTENYPVSYTTSTLRPLLYSSTFDISSPPFYTTTVRPITSTTLHPDELEIEDGEEDGDAQLIQQVSGKFGEIIHSTKQGGYVSSTTVASLRDGEAIVGVVKKDGYRAGQKPKVVVVSRLSDFNPILVGKLGAECSCKSQSKTLTVGKAGTRRGHVLFSPEEGATVVSTTTGLPVVEINPVTKTVIPAALEVSYNEEEGPTFAESLSEDNKEANLVRSRVEQVKTSGLAFDRYGPGGLRSVDETLQGSVDCQRAGLFRHPKYCNKFYSCNWDPWKKRFTLHVFNCPIHLAYDSNLGACNWPSKGPACADGNLLV